MRKLYDVYFASSNKHKFEEAKKILANFGINLKFFKCNLEEIQSDSIKEIAVKKAIDALESGQVLEIIGTDEGSKMDLPGWCERVGHSYLGVKEEANFFKFYIRKGR